MTARISTTLVVTMFAAAVLFTTGILSAGAIEDLGIVDFQYQELSTSSRMVISANLPFIYRTQETRKGVLAILMDRADTAKIANHYQIGSRAVKSVHFATDIAEENRQVTVITIHYDPACSFTHEIKGRKLFLEFSQPGKPLLTENGAKSNTAKNGNGTLQAVSDPPREMAAPAAQQVVTPPPAKQAVAKDLAQDRYDITSLKVNKNDGITTVTLDFSSAPGRDRYKIVPVGKPARYVMDFYGARNRLAQKEYDVTSPYFTRIRTAQNALDPEPITRIVFDQPEVIKPALEIAGTRMTLTFSSAAAKTAKTDSAPAVKPADMKAEPVAKPTEKKADVAAKPAEKKAEPAAKPVDKKAEVAPKPTDKKVDTAVKPVESTQAVKTETKLDTTEKPKTIEVKPVTLEPAKTDKPATAPAEVKPVEAAALKTAPTQKEIKTTPAPEMKTETKSAVQPQTVTTAKPAETKPAVADQNQFRVMSNNDESKGEGIKRFEAPERKAEEVPLPVKPKTNEPAAVKPADKPAVETPKPQPATQTPPPVAQKTEPVKPAEDPFAEQFPDDLKPGTPEYKQKVDSVFARPKMQDAAPAQDLKLDAPIPQQRQPQLVAGDSAFFQTREISGETKSYTGKKVSLVFESIPLSSLILLLGQMTDKNFIVDPSVRNVDVSISLQDIPWDQALDVILDYHGLGKVEDDNLIRIATQDKLASEATERRSIAEQRALAVPLRQITKPVNYARAADLAALLGRNLSGKGEVVVDARTNTLVISDIPSKVDEHLNLIEALDIPTKQVIVEARIVETTRDFINEFGLQYGFSTSQSTSTGNSPGWVFPGFATESGGFSQPWVGKNPLAINLPAPSANTSLLGTFTNIAGSFSLDVLLSAAESEKKVRVLSRPRISAQNNSRAEIKSGVEVPYQVIQNNTVSIRFREATLRLEVTPHITSDSTVIMDVVVDKSSLGIQTQAGFTVQTRQATSTIRVKDGGVAVIGGVLEVSESLTQERVPLISKIPLIGSLFRNELSRTQNTELLIFIAPKIIG